MSQSMKINKANKTHGRGGQSSNPKAIWSLCLLHATPAFQGLSRPFLPIANLPTFVTVSPNDKGLT